MSGLRWHSLARKSGALGPRIGQPLKANSLQRKADDKHCVHWHLIDACLLPEPAPTGACAGSAHHRICHGSARAVMLAYADTTSGALPYRAQTTCPQ
eukprot:3069514-Amphidinium_carterae.2